MNKPVGMWKFEWWSVIPALESYPYDDAVVVAGCGSAAFVEYDVYVGAFVYPFVHSAAPIKLFSAMTQSKILFLAHGVMDNTLHKISFFKKQWWVFCYLDVAFNEYNKIRLAIYNIRRQHKMHDNVSYILLFYTWITVALNKIISFLRCTIDTQYCRCID